MCDSSSIDVYAKSLGCFWETTLNNFPKLVSLIYPILFAKLMTSPSLGSKPETNTNPYW